MGKFNFSSFTGNENIHEQQIVMLHPSKLKDYRNHKFKLYDGERLDDMVASVKKNGILTPIIVRPLEKAEDTYEILSGHNRVNAAKLAQIEEVPALIKNGLSEEEAEMYVIETNLLQRGFNDLRITERAAVIALRYSKMFSQGKRTDIENEIWKLEHPGEKREETKTNDDETCALLGQKLSSRDKLAEEYGLSKNSIARLLRVDMLIDGLKEWIDNDRMGINAAVNISYINQDGQQMLYDVFNNTQFGVDMKHSLQLREAFENGDPTEDDIKAIILDLEKDDKAVVAKPIKIQHEIYGKYFTRETTAREIEETIDKALALYFKKERGR